MITDTNEAKMFFVNNSRAGVPMSDWYSCTQITVTHDLDTTANLIHPDMTHKNQVPN